MFILLLNIPSFFGVSIEVYFIVALLTTPFFFLWRRQFRKIYNSKLSVTLSSCLAALVTACVFYTALVLAFFAALSYYPKDEFSKDRWNAEKEKRYELSGDIIESKILIGKSKEEVEQLLGRDETIDEESDYWAYDLGFVPSLGGIDPDVLDIYFQNGKVIKVGQHET